jgi:hypothetical protein
MNTANNAIAPLSRGMPSCQATTATTSPTAIAMTVRIATRGQNDSLARAATSSCGRWKAPRSGS